MEGKVEVNSRVSTLPQDIAYIVSFKLPHASKVPQVLNPLYRKKIALRFAELISNFAAEMGLYITSISYKKNGKNYTVHITTSMPIQLIEAMLENTETPPNPVYNKKSKNHKTGYNDA